MRFIKVYIIKNNALYLLFFNTIIVIVFLRLFVYANNFTNFTNQTTIFTVYYIHVSTFFSSVDLYGFYNA